MEEQPPEESNRWGGGLVETECAWCGESLERHRVYIKKPERNFCNQQCSGKWKSENQTGEDNPVWKGGNDGFYGPNWRIQRQKALNRDNYACQACGMTDEAHRDRYGSGLHVHHIVRKEAFRRDDGSLDHECANELSNLATLCYEHHNQADRMAPLYPFRG